MNESSSRSSKVLAGLITGLLSLGASCHAQSDDFSDNNDTGWTRFNPIGIATYSAAGGVYHLSSPPSPNPATYGPARAASLRQEVVYSDFCVVVDIVAHNATLSQAIGIMARVQPNLVPGETDGYTFTYQPNVPDIQISRITNEQPEAVNSVALPFPPDSGTTLRLVLFGHGSYLEGRIYDAADLLTPLAVAFGDDATYPIGTCGVVVSNFSQNSDGPADATFDNYAANDGTPPPLVLSKNGTDGVALTWPDSALCWQLQTSTTMNPGSWSDVFTGITHQANEGTFSLAETFAAGGPKRFWRWWLPESL